MKSALEFVFKEATGADYSKFKEAIDKHKLDQPEEDNKLLGEIQKHLASNPAARLLLFEYVSDEFFKFHLSVTTNGSMQVTERLEIAWLALEQYGTTRLGLHL
jgi:hypothetical protein